MTDKEEHRLWERHRRTIEREFSKKDTRLKDVIEYMATYHDFIRSKTQYERQLKKWGARKKLTKSEWIAIISSVCKDGHFNSNVEVLWRGLKLPPAQIEREIKRYGSQVTRRSNLHGVRQSLPRHIEILAPASDSRSKFADSLQIVRACATRVRDISHPSSKIHDTFGLETQQLTTSSYIVDDCSIYDLVQTSFEAPFSWLESLKSSWSLFSEQQMQHMIPVNQPTKLQLCTIFYPNHEEFESTILYQLASLINNTVQVLQRGPKDLHIWLQTIPVKALMQFLDALPATIFDALRERLFVLAVVAGHAEIVSAMLALQVEPNQPLIQTLWSPTPMFPLEYAVIRADFLVAKALLLHLLRDSTPSFMDNLLLQVLVERPGNDTGRYYNVMRFEERLYLVSTLLEAGASPVEGCASALGADFSFLAWMQSSKVGLIPWLRLALARVSDRCGATFGGFREGMSIENLRYLLVQRLEDLLEESSGVEILLYSALKSSLFYEDTPRVEIIISALTRLGSRDDSNYASSNTEDVAYRQACYESNWALAAHIMVTKERRYVVPIPPPPPPPNFRIDILRRLRKLVEEEVHQGSLQSGSGCQKTINQKVDEEYQELIRDIDFAQTCDYSREEEVMRQALELRNTKLAIILHKVSGSKCRSFLDVLENADVAICSDLLLSLPTWRPLLRRWREQDDIGELAAIIHRGSIPLLLEFHVQKGSEESYRQLCMRVLSYHAIAIDDYVLFRWLLHLGLVMDELFSTYEALRGRTSDMDGSLPCLSVEKIGARILPSLLSVVAGRNDLNWVDHLRHAGANMRDSMALLCAVKSGGKIPTINKLLQAANCPACFAGDNYGTAALQEALRIRRMDIADILCKYVNIEGIELSSREWLKHRNAITPLGGAILSNDLDAARWLLDHGAGANTYVATFNTLRMQEDHHSFLPLYTPLLAAISKPSLDMIELLVEFGAKIEDARKSGLTRTPLQRAAEMGHFDIVKYFIDRSALIDAPPAYSGATALQLAAMSGHVGVARLLLERGADPNYPPARGDGRTAFEAAIEWGRVDMVSLLMMTGINLDLRVGDPPETQYERARRFAEKNGKFASKREAERLYTQFQAYKRSAETTASSLRIETIDEMWSPGPMPEPIW